MSTYSTIGIIKKDGTVECISCYFDGYTLGVGSMLYHYYKEQEKVEQLMELGDLDELHENIEPPEGVEHTVDHPAPHTTVSLKRERGDEETESRLYKNIKEFEKNFNAGWDDYAYLFDAKNQEWYTSISEKFDAENMIKLGEAIVIELYEQGKLNMNMI